MGVIKYLFLFKRIVIGSDSTKASSTVGRNEIQQLRLLMEKYKQRQSNTLVGGNIALRSSRGRKYFFNFL